MSILTGDSVLDLWYAATAGLEHGERHVAECYTFGALCEIVASRGVSEATLRDAFAAAAAFARRDRDAAAVSS